MKLEDRSQIKAYQRWKGDQHEQRIRSLWYLKLTFR